MILDSSALVAILFKEPDAERLAAMIRDADTAAIAAPTLLETAIVAEGRTLPGMAEKLDALMVAIRPEIVPFTAAHASLARDAWRRYGKGRHKAGLNLGDCFSYALAKERRQTLLFKGDDFAATDIEPAIKPHG
ncbi:MAG: type II toxin-antitoxin system VapC family toxin [Roseomonas sp.]|nr:type II toxin-antitoxin system VapC family toxin [Roseomonas sp.]MCA3343172.1 type II toxin-antitoxin system VapC family toxin [Roseomonas sp.]